MVNKTNIGNGMRESHNRQIQEDIDTERQAIINLNHKRNEYSPEIQNLEWRLALINTEVRKLEIDMDAREKRILILQDRFWK